MPEEAGLRSPLERLRAKVEALEYGTQLTGVADSMRLLARSCRYMDGELTSQDTWAIAFTLDTYAKVLESQCDLVCDACDEATNRVLPADV